MVFEVIPFAVCSAGVAALGAGGWTLAGGKLDTCGGRDGKGLSMKSQRSVEEIQSSMFGTDGSRNENKSYPKAHTGLSPRLGHVWETMAGTQDRREKPPPLRQEPVETRGPLRPSYDARGKPDISLARGLTMAFRQVDAPFTPESAAPARGQANISLARGITVASRQGDVGYAPSSAAPGSQPRPQPKASPEASFYVPPPPASLYVPPPEFTPASRASPAVISPPAPQHAATPPPSRTQPQQQSRPALQNKNAGVGISFVPSEQGKITIAHMVPGAPAAQSGELRVGDQVITVDDEQVQGRSIPDIIRMVLGPSGSQVRILVVPAGNMEAHTVYLIRSSPNDPRPASMPPSLMPPLQSVDTRSTGRSTVSQDLL